MTEFKQKLEAALEVIKKAQEEALKIVKEGFQSACAPIFEQDSRLESFGWRQYTNYFNDGDTTYFSARKDLECMEINGENFDDSEYAMKSQKEIYNRGYKPNPDYDETVGATMNMIEELMKVLDDEVLKSSFGDHVSITVFKDRVEVEEYTDHD